MDIAQNSTYRPAHRGTTPITAFYDFTLKFNGKSVATTPNESRRPAVPAGSLSPAAQQVATLIRQHKYAAAKSKAQSDLLTSPDDQSLRQMLGVAAFDAGDFTAAAAAFDKVPTIGIAVPTGGRGQLRRSRGEGGAVITRARRWHTRRRPSRSIPTTNSPFRPRRRAARQQRQRRRAHDAQSGTRLRR